MVLSSKFSAINIKEFSNQTHNYSNKTLEEICHIPQTFKNIYDFFECYRIVAIKEIDAVVFELFLAASVVFLNSLVVICMVFGSNKKTCFDKILFGYCLVDGVTGLFDIPLYHIRDVFGYWP
jgi:hypothetical protein